jgi:peptidyl-prolyl cis-trans isomerase D
MLDAMRRGAKTWVAKLLMIILVASFAVWGVADMTNIGGSTAVASVGSTEIEAMDFQRAYNRELQQLSRQMGQPVDRDFAAQIGLPTQVLSRMISDAVLTESAARLGLGVSDEELAREIADDPNLRPPGASSFDRGYFARLLQENGLTEAAYIAERRLFETRAQLSDAIVGGMEPPAAWVSALARHNGEKRAIEFAVLPASAAGPTPTPGESDLDTWYTDNKDRFRAPEYRKLSILAVTPEDIADTAGVTDDQVRGEYDRSLASAWTTPEKRRVRQVLFPTREEAEAAAARLKGGEKLDVIATERGVSPEDLELGLVVREDIVDPKIAEVAFALAPATASEAIEARFGFAVIDVTEIVPAVVRPFDEVKEEIRLSIATRDAENQVMDTHDEIEDARAGGATLDEIAERFKLKLVTVETDATGLGPDGAVIPVIPQSGEVIAAAFAADEGDETDPVTAGKGFVWFSVDAVTPAADRPLQAVRDDVVAAWTREKTEEILAAKAEEIADAVRKGGDLAALATAAGATVETAIDIDRGGSIDALGPGAIEAVFGGPTGHVAVVPAATGGHAVLRVTDATVPPFFAEAAESRPIADALRGQLGNSLLSLYIDQAEGALGTEINEAVVQAAIGTTAR